MPGVGTEGLLPDLHHQIQYIADRPAYVRLLQACAPLLDGWLGELLAKLWAGRAFNAGYERPLMLLAALRHDALSDGPGHGMYAALVQTPAQLDAITEPVLRAAFALPRVQRTLRERAIQTNETTRAVTWLWPAHLLAQAGAHEPLALVDLGTSAGLNLIADSLPAPWLDERGAPLEIAPRPPVALRLGIDHAPIDPRKPDDANWLRACVWQDDAARLERLEQGFASFIAASDVGGPDAPRFVHSALEHVAAPLAVFSGAAPALRGGAASEPRDQRVLLLQTLVGDYLPRPVRERYEQALRAFIAQRPALSALWLQLELRFRDEPFERSMALSVTFADTTGTVRELVLARTHPHPRVLHVDHAAVAEFLACVRAARSGA